MYQCLLHRPKIRCPQKLLGCLSVFAALLLLGVPNPTIAQPNDLPAPRASFVAVIVTDLDESITWYENILGFEVVNQVSSEERGFKQANLQAAFVKLELIELATAVSYEQVQATYGERSRLQGYFKFGMRVDSFDQWIEYLEKQGVRFSGSVVTDPVSGLRTVLILDPDGNRIQLFEEG